MYTAALNSANGGETWHAPQQVHTSMEGLFGLAVTYREDGAPLASAMHGSGERALLHYVPASGWQQHRTTFSFDTSKGQVAYAGGSGGEEWIFAATATGDREVKVARHRIDPPPAKAPFPQRVAFGSTVRQVLSGLSTHGSVGHFLVLLVDGSLSLITVHADEHTPVTMTPLEAAGNGTGVTFRSVEVRAGRETTASGTGGFWDIYAVDTTDRLWVIRQDRKTGPSHPRFCPPVPVAHGVGRAMVGAEQDAETSLFTYGKADRLLRLETQDPFTRMWREVDVLPPSGGTAVETVVHRVEARVTNPRGAPLPGKKVTVSVPAGASRCEIYWHDDNTHQGVGLQNQADGGLPRMLTVTADGQDLSTDASGRLVFWLRADGLATGELNLTVDTVTERVRPGQNVLTYLSGRGTLRETDPRRPNLPPRFTADGKTLQHLGTAENEETRKTAAAWMMKVAQEGLKSAPQGIVPAPEAQVLDQPQSPGRDDPQGWDTFTHWAADVWQGIKRGAIQVKDWAVQGSQLIVNGVTWLGKEFVTGAQLAIAGMQQAGHALAALFDKVGAALKTAIDWLKTLLDFPAMWRTKKAFEQGVSALFPALANKVTGWQKAADTWLATEKAQLEAALRDAKERYGGHKLGEGFGDGTPPHALRQHTTNPQATWLWDKVRQAPPEETTFTTSGELQKAWKQFSQNLQELEQGGVSVGQTLQEAGKDLLENAPAERTVTDIITLAQELINTGFSLCKMVVDGISGLVKAALAGIRDVLTAPLPVPSVLKTLWSWVVSAAGGEPDKEPLTLLSLLSLLAAVPVTIVYKLANSNTEPFPDGKLPDLSTRDAAARARGAELCMQISGIVTAVSVITAVAGDALGDATPSLVSGFSFILTAATLVLGNWALVSGTVESLGVLPSALFAGVFALFAGALIARVLSVGTLSGAWSAFTRVLPLVVTVLGVVALAYCLYRVAKDVFPEPKVATILAGVLGTLSAVTAALNFDSFRNEYTTPAKIAIDSTFIPASGVLIAVYAGPLTT
ncbi:hypothetical protein ACF06X_34490 [Streptomyces sp. NPDC015346]|uniref:hypothetical protein n=1 Tax=Streptomyces sp. NPDC015346 TaxID=3364954 RepID=UPI0036FE6755